MSILKNARNTQNIGATEFEKVTTLKDENYIHLTNDEKTEIIAEYKLYFADIQKNGLEEITAKYEAENWSSLLIYAFVFKGLETTPDDVTIEEIQEIKNKLAGCPDLPTFEELSNDPKNTISYQEYEELKETPKSDKLSSKQVLKRVINEILEEPNNKNYFKFLLDKLEKKAEELTKKKQNTTPNPKSIDFIEFNDLKPLQKQARLLGACKTIKQDQNEKIDINKNFVKLKAGQKVETGERTFKNLLDFGTATVKEKLKKWDFTNLNISLLQNTTAKEDGTFANSYKCQNKNLKPLLNDFVNYYTNLTSSIFETIDNTKQKQQAILQTLYQFQNGELSELLTETKKEETAIEPASEADELEQVQNWLKTNTKNKKTRISKITDLKTLKNELDFLDLQKEGKDKAHQILKARTISEVIKIIA